MDILTIFIQIGLNLKYEIIQKRKSVLCTLKKDVNHSNILKKSITSQEIDSKSNLMNNLIKKLLNILPILKR